MSKKKLGLGIFIAFIVLMTASIVLSACIKKEPVSSYPQYFNSAMAEEKPAFVFFYAKWCSHCVNFMPTYNELEKSYADKYNFIKVNVDNSENKDLVQDFYVAGIPTIYVIDTKNKKRYLLDNSKFFSINDLKEELDKYIEGK